MVINQEFAINFSWFLTATLLKLNFEMSLFDIYLPTLSLTFVLEAGTPKKYFFGVLTLAMWLEVQDKINI